ncbi:DUF2971 domain-containing protein [Photobacterium sp. BZF1]|uniref:DUF2971 domain-containing protein n=1 Tax=Photobacterium sp. BZF1 TaxID=1904457 RepID=UPI001653A40B|nr:DUF2971 domain-containing protein [Photobacterium sp. BZF1]MBC7001729.1 DUF2971 domain-containing protein [Photobacterium sp. BZF1]
MNDEMEGFELHQVLAEVLGLKYAEEQCKSALKLIDSTIDTYLRYQMSFSASTLKDDISQWRAYTTLGLGVCIEFEDGFIDANARKINCVYDFDSKRRAIIEDRNLKANDESLNNLLSTPNGTDQYVKSIISALIGFKNHSFKPEEEVRWVLSIDGANDNSIKYRPHRLGLTTYTEVPIDLSHIKTVTIGPQVPSQNLKTIDDFLMINDCPGVVLKSKVTLR